MNTNQLNKKIELAEILSAIKCMQKGKTPGQDGLPAEFYQCFAPEVAELLYEAYCDAEVNGCLFGTVLNGILNLIPKKGKDTRYLKN